MKYSNRRWHSWISVILALPILIVGLTAIFIAHDKALGLKQMSVNAGWLPGYGQAKNEHAELRATLPLADGGLWLAAKGGLVQMTVDGQVTAVAELNGLEIRALHQHQGQLLVAAKEGLYGQQQGKWQQLAVGEFWSISGDGQRLLATSKERGLLVSADSGRSWQPSQDPKIDQALPQLPPEPLTWHKLVMDLHTGKAFLGKEWEWLWIDLIGAVMSFLAISGLIMWWRDRQRQRQLHGG